MVWVTIYAGGYKGFSSFSSPGCSFPALFKVALNETPFPRKLQVAGGSGLQPCTSSTRQILGSEGTGLGLSDAVLGAKSGFGVMTQRHSPARPPKVVRAPKRPPSPSPTEKALLPDPVGGESQPQGCEGLLSLSLPPLLLYFPLFCPQQKGNGPSALPPPSSQATRAER